MAGDKGKAESFLGVVELEDDDEEEARADEKRLAAGSKVEAGRWGKGWSGIGGMDERA